MPYAVEASGDGGHGGEEGVGHPDGKDGVLLPDTLSCGDAVFRRFAYAAPDGELCPAAGEGDKAVVVFTCNYMNSELATMRSAKMTAVLENYSGLGVNARAVRFVDGKKGVFVLTGNIINFVPVNVLYSKDNLCICEKQSTGLRLKLYDEIVIKGKNLYDGKSL